MSVAASGRTHGAPVLNIAVIDATTAAIDYYVERQAGCASEYYTGSGEARGQWIGRGATALGLAGGIDDDAFRRLMNGVSPDGAARLAKPVLRVHPRGKLPAGPLVQAVERLAAERAMPAADLLERGSTPSTGGPSGLRVATASSGPTSSSGSATTSAWTEERCTATAIPRRCGGPAPAVDARAAGVDLCFRAPKSVAILFGLGAPDVARQVVAAHDAAVTARSATWTRSPATACVATTVTGQGHPGGDQRVHRSGLPAPHQPRRRPAAAHPRGGGQPPAGR